jgi:peptide/nickel transport system permease protein
MPAFALGWFFAAAHMRLTRSSILEVLGSEYVKLARLKGLPETLVIAKHAFKNALIPVLTLAGINLVLMVNVAVVVETVFAWPGIGRLLYEGIAFRDFPVVQATVLLAGIMIVVVNLAIDILYAVIDPRILRLATVRGRTQGFPMGPIAIVATLLLVAVFADFIAPHNPEIGSLGQRFKPPAWEAGGSTEYLLGTDHIGRDVLSRLIFGARVSMIVGFAAVVFAGVLGTSLGILSGYLGGWVDQVIMRVTDTWLALPALTFAIFLAAIVGPSEFNIIVILGAVYWTRYARVIRGEVLSLKERDFVRLAIVANCSKWTIMRRHLLPNVLNTAIVLATLMLGVVIVTEAALSFLGVGVPPPKPAWGLMLADGKKGLMAGYWWLTVFPCACIVLMVLSANLLGDWLRVKLDPQLRQL